MGRYAAVIFDLFGTLVDNATPDEYRAALAEMAMLLALAPEALAQAWTATAGKRTTGAYGSVEANVEDVCRILELAYDPDKAKQIATSRVALMRGGLTLRPDAVDTLTRLKATGYRLGLVSNCSSEVPAIWPELPLAALFDTAVFSCEVGLMKPDPAIYRLAAERLGVAPEDCLYIGDGESRELSGAAEAGMYAVRIRVPEDGARDQYREPWDRQIAALGDVLDLL